MVQVRLLEDEFHTKQGVRVALVSDSDEEAGELQEATLGGSSKNFHSENAVNRNASDFDGHIKDDEEENENHESPAMIGKEDEGFDWDYDSQPNLNMLAKRK